MSHRLLGVFAHPDDESFGCGGMLAKYVREGVDVHVCVVTDGAAGSYDTSAVGDVITPEELVKRRRDELACASRALGVTLHTLGFRDSGMEGSPDNHHPESLYQADLDGIARSLLGLVCEVRPQVMVTHDPTGGYYHPDHIRTNHAVTLTWRALADPAAYPHLVEPGCTLWQPDRLYYSVLPRSSVRWMSLIARLRRQDPHHFGRNKDIDLTGLGYPDGQISVRLDIQPYAAIKTEAGACHESQGGGSRASRVPGILRKRLGRYEYYAQAFPANGHPQSGLFDGIAE